MTDSWKKFCTRQDRESLWDGVYRVIRRAAGRQEDQLLKGEGVVLNPEQSVELLASTFFPSDDSSMDNDIHKVIREEAGNLSNSTQDDIDDPPFTVTELERTLSSFNSKKAPRPDGLTADIYCKAIFAVKDVFLGILNKKEEEYIIDPVVFPVTMERGPHSGTQKAK